MDWLTFSDHVIGHLAWPLALSGLIVFLSLRHRTAINDLVYRIQKAKVGLFEIQVAEATARAEQAELPPAPAIPARRQDVEPPATDDPTAWLMYLSLLAGHRPRQAVIEAYNYLVRYTLEACKRLDPELIRSTDGSPETMRLAARLLLAPKQAEVLDRLRLAAFSASDPREDVSVDQAMDYVRLATRLAIAIDTSVSEMETRKRP
jgi:hypothetical protein